jgi:hypothetical protein
MDARQHAWEILTPTEQMALHLRLNQGLSSEGIAKAMNKPIYKTIEHLKRGEKYLKMFTDFFEKYPSLFRPDGPCTHQFKDYMEALIEKRLIRREASHYADDKYFFINRFRKEQVIEGMKYLRYSFHPWDKDAYTLIVEYDRWNNNRILPQELQAPTAFRRRNKNRHRKYVQYLLTLPDRRIRQIIDYYYDDSGPLTTKRYIVMFSDTLFSPKNFYMCPFRDKDGENSIFFTKKLRLFVFTTLDDAEQFGMLVSSYDIAISQNKSRLFWKSFYEVIKYAENHDAIMNMDFTPAQLDEAYAIKRKPNTRLKKGYPKLKKIDWEKIEQMEMNFLS